MKVALQLRHSFLLAFMSSAAVLCACQADAPQPKITSTQDLLAQVEAIEADESVLLFQQAKAAAENDNVKEAKSLVQKALGRGAGSNGIASAEAEIKKAEARIAERKRKAEDARRAREAATSSDYPSSSYKPNESEKQVRSIIVTAEANKWGRNIEDFRLFRSGGDFSDLNGSSISILKPYSGTIGGRYNFSLNFKFKPQPLADYKRRSCSGALPISGYKQYVRVVVYEDCRIEINES